MSPTTLGLSHATQARTNVMSRSYYAVGLVQPSDAKAPPSIRYSLPAYVEGRAESDDQQVDGVEKFFSYLSFHF